MAQPLPDAPIIAQILCAWDERDFAPSIDALAAWFNGRWAKTGYSLPVSVFRDVLVANGWDEGVLGLGDERAGAFVR